VKNKETIDFIVSWLLDYAKESGVNGFVVGVSGGIDSALTSTLCAKTGLPTMCLEMPIHQEKKQQNRSLLHLEWLKKNFGNVQTQSVELTQVFDAFQQTVGSDGSQENRLLSLANARARIRMTTLYYYAGVHGYLVAGTGNKVEDFGVGFYTKYGDGGVDISPIADLMKSEVQSLAKTLGVDMSIVTAAPTDGLWGDDRTDEDQLGASYPELEWAMNQRDLGKQVSDFEGRQKTVFEILEQLNKKNLHKMIPIPVCEIPNSLR
jgi:NAD+ synthase